MRMIDCRLSVTAYTGLASGADFKPFESASWTSGLKTSEVVIAPSTGSSTSYTITLASVTLLNPSGEASCAIQSLIATSSSSKITVHASGMSLTANTQVATTSPELIEI